MDLLGTGYRPPDEGSPPSVRPTEPDIAYCTERGVMYHGTAEQFLASDLAKEYRGKVQLIFTSPPFPLNRKKKYGNMRGQEYCDWLASYSAPLVKLLKPDGSIVIELGNAWERGQPVMSTLALKALLAFMEAGKLHLCQQFVCYNPARLPSPAQWVNVKRVRVKDAFTNVWWMSPTQHPEADNRRVLKPYSEAMASLLRLKKYNSGRRPSQHNIGAKSFLTDNGGAIPSNVLTISNTRSNDAYLEYCRLQGHQVHPARMPLELPSFFVKFLTKPKHLILDPFGGSCTTGAAAEALKRRWVAIEPTPEYVAGSRGWFEPAPTPVVEVAAGERP